MSIYDYKIKSIDGQNVDLHSYNGKVLLVVNVASKCGFTNQYEGLEKIYEEFKDKGFVVLGFPCNQFGAQEPSDEAEIKKFCSLNYQVTFPMFSKVEVNGKAAHPLFQHLKKEAPGILGTEAIKWNFTKFLVDREGRVLKRFAPKDTPESLIAQIKDAL